MHNGTAGCAETLCTRLEKEAAAVVRMGNSSFCLERKEYGKTKKTETNNRTDESAAG